MNGLDGMRYLGADPATPADDVERVVMVLLNNRIVTETKAAERRAAKGR
jgi:hypothetical protein